MMTIWSSPPYVGTSIQFFQCYADGETKPLGDYALAMVAGPPVNVTYVAPGSDPAALAPPTGFAWLLDDKGSGNFQNLNYWLPIAPDGYRAMGVCFTNGDVPDVSSYWCVAERYCVPCEQSSYWSDSGQGFAHHDGSLARPSLPQAAPGVTVPTTFISSGGPAPLALRTD
jgi:hypothetical protein